MHPNTDHRPEACANQKRLLEMTDKIYRSFGILTYAQTLSVSEFMNLSSSLRLGIECSLFDGLTTETLNRITMS